MRKKERGEKRKAVHGAAIWNFLSKGGHDPGDYDAAELDEVTSFIVEETEEILEQCGRTHRPQVARIRDLLRAAVEELAGWVARNIEAGGLGQNAGRYAKKKKALTHAGILPNDLGTPAPRGFRTGRFLRGIKGRWVQGGRRKHARRLRAADG